MYYTQFLYVVLFGHHLSRKASSRVAGGEEKLSPLPMGSTQDASNEQGIEWHLARRGDIWAFVTIDNDI